jgi:hypothetical protein
MVGTRRDPLAPKGQMVGSNINSRRSLMQQRSSSSAKAPQPSALLALEQVIGAQQAHTTPGEVELRPSTKVAPSNRAPRRRSSR